MAETGITARFSSAVLQKGGGITQRQLKQRQLAVPSQPQGNISSRGGTKLTQQYESNNNVMIGLAKESQGWSSESSQSTNTNTYFDLGSDSSKHNSKIYHKKTPTTHQQFEQSSSPSSEQSRLDLLRMIYMKKLHTRLYEKFSQSQNYYYTRDVSDLLAGSRTSFTIKQKDQITIDEQEEYLKRIYYLREYPQKIRLLTEYYKFHSDIPRLFMQQLASIMNHMHDKKRKIEYFRIAKLIEEENKKNPTKPPKVIAGDVPAPGTEESMLAKKEKQTGKDLEKGLSCFLEDISSFVNKTGNVHEIVMQQNQGETNMKDSGVASINRFQVLQRQQTTAQRLKLERQQLEELKERQQKQQQRLHKLSQNINDNNNESSLSIMNSRLRDMLQISRMSQSNMQSETTIQDISENHGLDDFLKFLSKQSASFIGSQENTLTGQNTRSVLKPANQQNQPQTSQQLTLLSASQQISLKAAPQPQQNYQQQLQQQQQQLQMQQKSAFTRTVVASLQEKSNKIQQSEYTESNSPAKSNQQEQQKYTDSELNQYLKQSPRVIRHAQQQQSKQQEQQPQVLIDSLPQHLQSLCQANNLTNQNSEHGHNNPYPLPTPKSPKSQDQQLLQQPSLSSTHSTSSTNPANLTKNQNPLDLKLNLVNLNQAVIRSATGSLKNSFGGNSNNPQQSSNTNKMAYSIANNADPKNANRNNNNEMFQNTSNGKQQQIIKRGGTASSAEDTIIQSSQNNKGLQLQIAQGVANSSSSAQNPTNSYPLTSRVQNNQRNYQNFNINTPRGQLISKEQNNIQGLVQQQEQQLLSTGSTFHSRHASTYKTQEQQQQPQLQQQDRMIASQGQQQLQNNNNTNNNQVGSQQQQQQSLSQYQQQFKISKLKKNSINSLHLFSSQQQLISPRTTGGGGETDNQIDHILENNNNNNNNQQLSRQQSGNSSSNGGQGSKQGITPLSQQKNNPTAMGSSLSTRNSSNVVKALSTVNTPTHASNNNNNNKPSQVFTFNGLTSSNTKESSASSLAASSVKNQPAGSIAMASTMSSFRQQNTQNNNQQNLINSPQGSQHSILLQAATAQQQQPQQQQQQFNSYLRTASTGFNGNLLLQPPQQPTQISNPQSNNPSGSITARNQPSSTNSMHLRQHSNPTTGLTKNSLQSLHRFNYNSNNSNNINSAKINSENVYSQHNQDYFQSANVSPQPPPPLPVSQTLHTNSNIGSPRSMDTTKPSFFGSTSRTRPSLQSHQQLQVFIQEPQQQQQSKQPNPQHSHKYTKSEAQGMLTQSHTFFQAQEYTNTPSSAFSAFTLNSANSLASLTDRGKLQSKPQQQSAAFGQFQQHQQSSGQYTMQSNPTEAKLIPVNQNTSAKQMLAQHASQGITLPQQISSGTQQPSQQQQQPYQLSSNNNSSHMKNISPRQQLAFPLSKV